MSTLWRKVLADLWANKTRTFLMVLTITLGVFSVGFVGNMGAMMNRDADREDGLRRGHQGPRRG